MLFSMLISRWSRHSWFFLLFTNFMVSFYAFKGIMERRHSVETPEWVIAAVGGWLVFSSFLVLLLSCIIPIGMDLLKHFRSAKWRELGLRYALEAKGDGRDSHAVKAAKYFMKNALLFDNTAIVNLGLCYACGFGVDKDSRKAAKCYRVAAGEGDSLAKFALGLCYADGIGVERDKIKAEDLFSKTLCYEGNLDKFWNKNEVLMWLREAGERGNASVQKCLGDYYMAGKDYAEAVKWFRKAAEIGYDYSALHDSSFRGRKKRGEALRKRSIKASAYMQLAKIYLHGGNGVEKDEAEAVQLFPKAAEQGNAEAQILLASCYLSGTGVAKDEAEAIVWFRRAAKQDGFFDSFYAEIAKQHLEAVEDSDSEAQCRLALAYKIGLVCIKNDVEAVKWYRKAAEQGNADAQAALSDSIGERKDDVSGWWYHMATVHGDAYVIKQLDEFLQESDEKIDNA